VDTEENQKRTKAAGWCQAACAECVAVAIQGVCERSAAVRSSGCPLRHGLRNYSVVSPCPPCPPWSRS